MELAATISYGRHGARRQKLPVFFKDVGHHPDVADVSDAVQLGAFLEALSGGDIPRKDEAGDGRVNANLGSDLAGALQFLDLRVGHTETAKGIGPQLKVRITLSHNVSLCLPRLATRLNRVQIILLGQQQFAHVVRSEE